MEQTRQLISELHKQHPSTELGQRAAAELDFLLRAVDQLRTELVRASEEIFRLMELLADANDAFDEATANQGYLVGEVAADEPWRMYRYEIPGAVPESSDSCERERAA